MGYYNAMAILFHLSPGSPVSIWFDNSGFIATYFQFANDHQAAFSGGGLDGGLTYINISDLRAIKVGH
ncbi:hypothetical protein [Alicyclobacillus mengziensis]|uniref:Uncharacterized protein n=1 Tax=Alicyclobacillus mengziensis TaxID=2931921 RepID=A0A9X7Z836_9BACL|nr:hypothetical protein [Alicyclobacillus mengziensis]QSO47868.1 hypothetical protein JZ786_02160 [Alicyclobacillus mengziensis]